jgi:putative addiction module killer protein
MYIIEKTEVFDNWLRKLKDITAKAKILAKLKMVTLGSLGDHKSVGDGIFEMRINYGPGYRLYYAMDGRYIVLLLIGGTKSQQQKDIERAKKIRKWIGDTE